MSLKFFKQYRNYSKLYVAGLCSELGSFITDTAIMLYLFHITGGDKAYIGISRGIFLFFFTVGSIWGGPIGEKKNKKNILILCEIIRIPAVIFMFFNQSVVGILICSGVIALFTGLFNPTRQAMTNELVPPDDMNKANSIFGTTFAFIHVIGPVAGAYLFSYSSKTINSVLVLDLISYILATGLLLSIKYRYSEDKELKESNSIFSDLKEGVSFIKTRLDLISLYFNISILGLAIGILLPMLLPFTKEVLLEGEKEYGYAMAVFGIGGIIGGLCSHYLSKKIRPGLIIVIGICLECIMFNVFAQTTTILMASFVLFLWGVIVFSRVPSQLNYLSRTVETKFLSRCHSVLNLTFVIPNILGSAIIGVIGNIYTSYDILKYAGIVFFLMTFPRLFFKEMKALYKSEAKQVARESENFG